MKYNQRKLNTKIQRRRFPESKRYLQKLIKKSLQNVRQPVRFPPPQSDLRILPPNLDSSKFDFGKIFPDIEDISPIKLDLGDLGKELSLLDSPIDSSRINENKLPDVVVSSEKTTDIKGITKAFTR